MPSLDWPNKRQFKPEIHEFSKNLATSSNFEAAEGDVKYVWYGGLTDIKGTVQNTVTRATWRRSFLHP